MEFPYLLSFGNKDVLMLGSSPVRYWVGWFDREKLKFIPDQSHCLLLDYSNPFHCFNPPSRKISAFGRRSRPTAGKGGGREGQV